MMTCDICGQPIERTASGGLIGAQSALRGEFSQPAIRAAWRNVYAKGIFDLDNVCAKKLDDELIAAQAQAVTEAERIVIAGIDRAKL